MLEDDKAALRGNIVPAMLALSSASDKAIRAQMAETASLIAELDFPARWPELINVRSAVSKPSGKVLILLQKQLVNSLSPTDYNVNLGILETSHSIFRRWRHQVRSDRLFGEINLVLSTFMDSFLQLYRQTADLLLNNATSIPSTESHVLIASCAVQLNNLFYDLTCQDLPPGIEDSHEDFFRPGTGLFHLYMQWDPALLRGDPDDAAASLPSQVKSSILEVVEVNCLICIILSRLTPLSALHQTLPRAASAITSRRNFCTGNLEPCRRKSYASRWR